MLIFSLQNFSVHHMFWPLWPLPVCGMHRISGCRDLDTQRSLALFRGILSKKLCSTTRYFTMFFFSSRVFLPICMLCRSFSCSTYFASCSTSIRVVADLPRNQQSGMRISTWVKLLCHTNLSSHYHKNTFEYILVQESWELHFATIRC